MLNLNIGEVVYFCRIIRNCDIYELIELRIRTVHETWFVGCDINTKQAFLFSKNNIDKNIFFNRNIALKTLKIMKKNYEQM